MLKSFDSQLKRIQSHLELGNLSLIEHGEDIGSCSLGAFLCRAATCCCLT